MASPRNVRPTPLAGTDEVREYSYDYRNQLAASTVKNVITETITVEGEADEDGNPGLTTQTVAGSSHDYYLYIEDAKRKHGKCAGQRRFQGGIIFV